MSWYGDVADGVQREWCCESSVCDTTLTSTDEQWPVEVALVRRNSRVESKDCKHPKGR